jgi:hypothetical protein
MTIKEFREMLKDYRDLFNEIDEKDDNRFVVIYKNHKSIHSDEIFEAKEIKLQNIIYGAWMSGYICEDTLNGEFKNSCEHWEIIYKKFEEFKEKKEVEEEEEILKAEEEIIETEKEEIIEEKVIETEKESFLEAEFEFATQGDIDFRFSKKLEPKYYEYNGKKELNAQEGYRLYIISITNGDLEDANELITDLQKMASLKGIHCFKYDMDEYNNLSMTSKIQFAVDDSHLKEFNKVYKEWAEGWSLNSEEKKEETKKEETKYQIGQILYNCGDMANNAGWYKITNINIDKFGIFYDVKEIGGNRKNTYHEVFISEVDKNNGSTRIVTKEAREVLMGTDYVKRQLDSLFANKLGEEGA